MNAADRRVMIRGALAAYGYPLTAHEIMDACETFDDLHKTLVRMTELGELEWEHVGNTNQRRYRLFGTPPMNPGPGPRRTKPEKTKQARKPAAKESPPPRKRAPGAGRPAKNFAEAVHDGGVKYDETKGGRIVRFGSAWKTPREPRRRIDLSMLGWRSPLADL